MKTKHQSINQESVNNVEVQDWWVHQALTIHIFWEKIKTNCSIDGTQAGETEIMWVMRVAIFAVGGMATFMALTIPTIYGLWWLSHPWSFSLKIYFWLVIIANLQGSLFWPGLCHPLSSGDLKSQIIYINKCHSLANFIRKVNLSRLWMTFSVADGGPLPWSLQHLWQSVCVLPW